MSPSNAVRPARGESLSHWAWLLAAAFVGGGINSVAGGGSFLTFPALLLAGVPAIPANATNNTAMWLGVVASARGYREEIRTYRSVVLPAILVSLVGSVGGAVLLLHTPPKVFERMIPWLLLFATVVFAISPLITRAHKPKEVHSPWQLAAQFCVADLRRLFRRRHGNHDARHLDVFRAAEHERDERREKSALDRDQRHRRRTVRRSRARSTGRSRC